MGGRTVGWTSGAGSGGPPPAQLEDAAVVVSATSSRCFALAGLALPATGRRSAGAFAACAATIEQQRLAAAARTLAEADRTRIALLAAVSHDLRTPLAAAQATTSLRRDGVLVPMDQAGNPSFNPILNADDIKDEFNATDPVDDVKNHLQPLSEALQRHGYPPDEATATARTLLPDILHYDRTKPARYPNGRVMTDDVFSARMIFMTHGQATPQDVRPHDDLLAHFPYLGPPNP
jgi:signal transduction histidine kinase